MEWQHLPVPLLSSILSPSSPIVWSLHSYIPSCGWSLRFSCSAAEGVTEGCTLRVLLLTLKSSEYICPLCNSFDHVPLSEKSLVVKTPLQISIVRHNLAMHRLVTPFIIRQPIHRPCLLERVYKPMCTPH